MIHFRNNILILKINDLINMHLSNPISLPNMLLLAYHCFVFLIYGKNYLDEHSCVDSMPVWHLFCFDRYWTPAQRVRQRDKK